MDERTAHALLAAQFPQWADLPIRLVAEGRDNAIFRLGSDLALRLPVRQIGVEHLRIEQKWLPVVGPLLPLDVPEVVGVGAPDAGYPWPWSVCRWLPGDSALDEAPDDPFAAAKAMASFVRALQAIDPVGAPTNTFRAGPLSSRTATVRAGIAKQEAARTLANVWTAAVDAPLSGGRPVWMHGDLHPGNLVVAGGALRGVVDFGLMGAGDPACDLMVAWTLLTAAARREFRRELDTDEATWARGRGWALAFGLMCVDAFPPGSSIGALGARTLREITAD